MIQLDDLPDLAQFVAGRRRARPVWLHPTAGRLPDRLGPGLEEALDTFISVQRAEWLEEGVPVGPRTTPARNEALVQAAARLGRGPASAVLSPCAPAAMDAFGTNARPFLRLSSYFLAGVRPEEEAFAIGRVMGHVVAEQVTLNTLYRLLVDDHGLAAIAHRLLGARFDLLFAPLSVTGRLALASWHRAATLNADRAGAWCVGDAETAASALVHLTVGVRQPPPPNGWLHEAAARAPAATPTRWAEALSGQPWLNKRLRALALFARSEPWIAEGHQALPGPPLAIEALRAETDALLRIT